MAFIQSILQQSPEIALFLSLAGGYWIGKFHLGSFQLGGVAGSLLAAVAISQFGVHIDSGIKSVLFALFIYAVGFESGPQFFRSLGRQSLREIAMAVVLAVSGLITVIILARVLGLDKGLAAGVAAGGLTQSAIIGTAGAAITKLGLAADEVQRLQANVAIGYAVTYIFGSFGAIIVCVNALEWLMGRSIRDDAIKAEAAMLSGTHAEGEQSALPELVGRLFSIDQAAGKTLADLERMEAAPGISIERVKRNGQLIGNDPGLALLRDDIVLVVGRRSAVVAAAPLLGAEVQSSAGMDVVVVTRDVVISNAEFSGHTVAQIRAQTGRELKHGIFVVEVKRAGQQVVLAADTGIATGDVVTLYGTVDDVQRVARRVGPMIIASDKTDFVFHGMGLVCGLLVGLLTAHIGSIPLTLGSGGGALLSGLLFGWYRTRHMTLGNMPTAASTLLRDLGLAGFVAVVGLQTGQQAVTTIAQHGVSIFLVGVAVTIIPLLITMLFGRYVLRYDNAAVLAGALSGSRSANPAFGEILDKAGNSVPTIPFAVTYALANVFLTLLGPLVVAFA
ncbi:MULTISPECIES: aspartate-alanine antiporter [unclassified Duganella]|uniref:aspartate-alanine antiporter n=1 Tax=unclassified Duganella TaxID=2636909 RepID=UPI000E341FA6|nr:MULTISPECIES: aspartate-alanine antiporter [unclassified Duganella]RFP12837.1 aspartate-alanine antiporter [Duganella sp. BJB475]RFP28846.1 aspartate-alanine antiporter [Duganella sp. BJB476]